MVKTDIGQIFLTHPRDDNFTTLFEEAFQKQGETVELFAVIEIENQKSGRGITYERADCEKLAGGLVGALKKTYITAPVIDQNTFEKALTAVNAALARFLRAGKTGWLNGLNVALGALCKNELSVSACGNAKILLWRGNEITGLDDGLAETAAAARPAKIFSNYSSGPLKSGDRLVFSTKQLFNYLSLERLQEHLIEDTVAGVCQEIIADLAESKTTGFAAFVFDFETDGKGKKSAGDVLPNYRPKGPAGGRFGNTVKIVLAVLAAVAGFAWKMFKKIGLAAGYSAGYLFAGRKKTGRGKKWILAVVGILILLLLGNLGFNAVRKSLRQRQTGETNGLQQIETILQAGESALIYQDQKTAAESANAAEKLLAENANTSDQNKRQELAGRLEELKNKINKTIRVDNPTVLTTFAHVPTDLLRSSNGILAFNRDSVSLAYYDFRTGSAAGLLTNQNLSRLTAGTFVGGEAGYVFLDRDGVFSRLDLEAGQLAPYATAGPKGATRLQTLGAGQTARLYALDRSGNQIWRVKMGAGDVGAAEPWFKTAVDLNGAADMAVDGSIYLLRGAAVEKYFNAAKQNFTLSPAIPPMAEPAGIFTNEADKFLYVLEPKESRILVFDKTAGNLQNQFVSPKFREAADLYADEAAKIIYIIAGNELLQINY